MFRKYTYKIRFILCIIGGIITSILSILSLTLSNLNLTYFITTIVYITTVNQGPAIVVELLQPECRATGSQVYAFSATFFGSSLTPYIVGKISDSFIDVGETDTVSLRYGLFFVMIPTAIIAILCWIWAFQSYKIPLDGKINEEDPSK